MCMDRAVTKVEDSFRRWGIIDGNKKQFVRQRIGIAIIYSTVWIGGLLFLSVFAHRLINIPCPLLRRMGYISFFGLLGLSSRSWSFINQGESPFPPYVLTYPLVTSFACLAFCAAPLEGRSFILIAPLVGFFLGYMPMDIYETVKSVLGKAINKNP